MFLAVNGVILIAGERFRRPDSLEADERIAARREAELVMAGGRAGARPPAPGPTHARPRAASGGGMGQSEEAAAVASDRRLSTMGYGRAIVIGSAQILALFAGISRDGVTMVTGMRRGLSREDAVRFAFLLSTPVIFAAGVLKIPDLFAWAARPGHRWPDPARQHPVLHRRLRRDPVPSPLPPHQHSLPVRHLLPGRGPGLRGLPRLREIA